MALSSPPPPLPPPPHPPSSTPTLTSTPTPTPTPTPTLTTIPLFPTPPLPPPSNTQSTHPHPYPYPTPPTTLSVSYPPLPPPPYLYPVGSSGRGYYPPKQPNPQLLPSPYDNPPNIDSGAPQLPQVLGFMPPPHHFHNMLPTSIGGVSPPVVNGVPLFKMSSNQTPVIENNGFKEASDRSRDDSFVIVRGRKVRVSENSSLYALCRSWLRNGLPEETEPPYIDVVKSLPRPLPLAPQVFQSPGKKEEQEEDEEEEGAGFVEHLSHQELLQKHIKRAKRVRSRLREERLRRIARYKTRLSLLLPPLVEPHCRNESTAGNGNAS